MRDMPDCPECPLCNSSPKKKGDIAVVAGEHTDRDCKTHLGEKEKIFPYQCSQKRDARGKRYCQ